MKITVARVTVAAICVTWSVSIFAADDSAKPVTLGGFGHRVVPRNGANGDTWDGAWLATDKVYLQHDDGHGWEGKGGYRGIGELLGTPEAPSSLSGANIPNKFLAQRYSSGIYEVDGVLYHIKCDSDQGPRGMYDHNIFKSLDGGTNWVNCFGELNKNPKRPAMFPEDRSRLSPWLRVNFVKYGKGGVAPDVDTAQTYVYLSSYSRAKGGGHGLYQSLARMKRSDLPSLDRTKIQFYTGGDGMLDQNWTNDISQCVAITNATGAAPGFSVVYNFGLRRYISISNKGTSWSKPPSDCSLFIFEAPHPWGPWTQLLEENANEKEGDYLCWSYLLQKFTSADGKKMWMTLSGRKPYALQFMPVYLTTAPLQSYEAETATLTGTTVSHDKLEHALSGGIDRGYSGGGYVTGFDAAGDECLFKVKAEKAGAYILKIRYNTRQCQKMDFLVNGTFREKLKLGKSEQGYATWTEMSLFAWLEAGDNTVAFRCGAAGESADVNLDSLSLAFYSDAPGSLQDCSPRGKP